MEKSKKKQEIVPQFFYTGCKPALLSRFLGAFWDLCPHLENTTLTRPEKISVDTQASNSSLGIRSVRLIQILLQNISVLKRPMGTGMKSIHGYRPGSS